MDLNNLTPEQQQQVVQLLHQIQGQNPTANATEQITSAMQQQQASTTLVENIKILAVLKLLSARVQQQPNNMVQDAQFGEGPQRVGPKANNNAGQIGDSSVLLQQILELKRQMINNPNDEGFGIQGQPPQQFEDRHEHYNSTHNDNNTHNNNHHDRTIYRREHSPPRWHNERERNREREGDWSRDRDRDRDRGDRGDRDRERGHSPPRRERSPPHSASARNRPPKWMREQSRNDRHGPAQGTVPTPPPPIGQGAVFAAQNPTEILASYLTDEDVVIPKFPMMQPVISVHSSTPKRPKHVSDVPPPQLSTPSAVTRPKSEEAVTAQQPALSPVKASVGKAPPSMSSPKKMSPSPLKGPSTTTTAVPPSSSVGKVPPPPRKGPPLTSAGTQKPAKISLEGIPPPYPPPKHPPKQQFNPSPLHPPQSVPPKHYAPKINPNISPRPAYPPKQSAHNNNAYHTPSSPYQANSTNSYAPPQHASYSQPAPYKQPQRNPSQTYHPPPQVPNAAPSISSGARGHGSNDPFQGATVEDLQQVHQFLTEVLEIQQGAKDKAQRPSAVSAPRVQPGKPVQQVGPALPPQASSYKPLQASSYGHPQGFSYVPPQASSYMPPQASSYVPPQVKKPYHPPPISEAPVPFKKQKTEHYPPTSSVPKQAPRGYPPTAGTVPVAPTPQTMPPQPVAYPGAVPATYPGYSYPYPYPAYDYSAAYQYYYGAAYAQQPGVAPATVTYPPPGYYPAVPPGYPKK